MTRRRGRGLRLMGGVILFFTLVFAVDGTIDGLTRSHPDKALPPGMISRESPALEAATGLSRTGLFYRGTIIASDPTVTTHAGRLRMFYTDLDHRTDRTVIATADSRDGRTWSTDWTRAGIRGLVISGRDDSWDQSVESAAILRTPEEWRLYFSGYRQDTPLKGFPAALWLATSQDGRTFTRVSDAPILEPTPGWYDNDAIYSPTVIPHAGGYVMIYVGHAYTDTSRIPFGGVYLLGATSPDGRTWTKIETPLARPGDFDGWRRDGLAEPDLVRKGPDEFVLFYTGLGGEERAIGVAHGSHPLGPFRFGERPILEAGRSGDPDEALVLHRQ